jgi:hypothetical protein
MFVMRRLLFFAVTTVFFFAIASCSSNKDNKEQAFEQCDRQCLEGFVNQYLDGMVAHDASAVPFSENVRFTENAKESSFAGDAESLWSTSTGMSDYKFYVADPQAGQVAFVGLVSEGDRTAILSMRLRIENNEITEVESIVVRNRGENVPWTMKTPPAAYSQALAPEERVSREELVRISSVYFDGIEQLTGKIVPWHDECYRLENGMWTAGTKLPDELAANMPETEPKAKLPGPGGSTAFGRGACTEAFDSGVFALIESIQPRRTPVVDEERGVTWGVYMFNHPGVETITMPDGSTQPAAYFVGQPNSMPMSELFKITGGKIRDIMAVGVVNEYKSGSGWE